MSHVKRVIHLCSCGDELAPGRTLRRCKPCQAAYMRDYREQKADQRYAGIIKARHAELEERS